MAIDVTIEVNEKQQQELDNSIANFFTDRKSRFLSSMRSLALDLRKDIADVSPVGLPKKNRAPGWFKKSWYNELISNPLAMTVSFGNDVPYARFHETGSFLRKEPWPKPGPRTQLVHDRVRSTQAPFPVVQQSIDKLDWEKFNKEVEAILK